VAERIPSIYTLAFVQCPYDYEQLLDFVQNRMKVSHVYLPVMHLELLRGGCSIKETDRSIILQVE
jgi:hypothetical protein